MGPGGLPVSMGQPADEAVEEIEVYDMEREIGKLRSFNVSTTVLGMSSSGAAGT